MNEQRNLILAVIISVAVLFGWQWLFPAPPAPPPPSAGVAATATSGAPAAATTEPQTPSPTSVPQPVVLTREQALAGAERIPLRTARLHGSIALKGARLDDLTLVDYHEAIDPSSPEVTLLSPTGSPAPYYAEFGWVPMDPQVKTPDSDSVWSVTQGTALAADGTVKLVWDNGAGLRFHRSYGLDQNYLFSVGQQVENYGAAPISLRPYGLISRTGTPHTEGMYILHEGPIGEFNGTREEPNYKDVIEKGKMQYKTTGGWIGITDKYWLVALIPDQTSEVEGRFVHQRSDSKELYQTDFTGKTVTVAPGSTIDAKFNLFAGAKQLSLLESYGEQLNVKRFDRAIDFGWFYPLTIGFFKLLQWLHSVLGNMGLAILSTTVLAKLIMFPLANKSYSSMSKMKLLQPEMKKLQERFAEDKPRLQQEIMALYKREKVNPVSGCLPMVIQIPVFFALYKVLFVSIEMRHAPFYGWIHDLSAPDPTNIFTLFGLIPWSPPSLLHLGIWPLVMGLTMWLQQKLNPQPADPVQAKMFAVLPIVFTFLLANFSAGLVIYWAWNNTLSILQQWVIMRKAGATR